MIRTAKLLKASETLVYPENLEARVVFALAGGGAEFYLAAFGAWAFPRSTLRR